jgi:hypothetical protein
MITRRKYVEALDLIDDYHKQLYEEVNSHRIKIKHFKDSPKVKKLISSKLEKSLDVLWYQTNWIYIDEVYKKDFIQIRGFGEKMWDEFEQIRTKITAL